MECFEELSHDDPQAAEGLTGLVVNCFDLPARLREDPMWRLHRAILATLPGVTFME
jgi:hypothetical protein